MANATDSLQTIEERQAPVRRVLWVTLALNLLVAATKIGYGYFSGIISLQADGFHTVFDALSNVIGLVALGIARQPPDKKHPYGHRKLEVAASIVIGIMVLLGFLEVGRAVWDAAIEGTTPNITAGAYGVVLATIVINLGISFWERHEGEKHDSMILKSDSAHTFSDSLAAGSVLVGMYVVDQWGIATGDVIAALAVMMFIGMTAYRVLKEGIDVLVDTSYLEAENVQRIVEKIPEVRSCHYVRSRGMPGHIHVDLHLTLDPDMKLSEAGDIMLDVKNRIKDEFENVVDIVIQIEPHKPEHVEDVPEQLV